jgi:hypothetical protein
MNCESFRSVAAVGILSMVPLIAACRSETPPPPAPVAVEFAAPTAPAAARPDETAPAAAPASATAAPPIPTTNTDAVKNGDSATAADQPGPSVAEPKEAPAADPKMPPGSLAEALAARAQSGEPDAAKTAEQELEEGGYVSPTQQVRATLADPPNATRLSQESSLWIDAPNRRVIVDGYVAQQEAYLEMFGCPAETKEHESVVAVIAKASEVHAALLAVGANPGKPVRFQPEYVAATGPRIRIWVLWRDPTGQVQVADARQWVRRTGTQESLDRDWVFAGSTWWTDPQDGREYYQADSGEMICVSNFGTAMLDLPIPSSDSTSALQFETFKERIPPRGTPIRLVLVPLPETAGSDAEAADAWRPDETWLPLRETANPVTPAAAPSN